MRRVMVLTPIAAVVAGFVVVLANLPDGQPLPVVDGAASAPLSSPAPTMANVAKVETESKGYLVSLDDLRRRGSLAAAGVEPYQSAVADLAEWADDAIDDVSQPTQPLVIKGTDNPFVDDARRAYGLGLAYGLRGDERYAEAARQTIRDWIDVARTTSDTCPDSGGCHTSLILGRAGAGFAFGADLIVDSRAWTDDDRADLQAWMRDVLLPAVSERLNNWGDAGTFLRVVAADYAGDQREFDRAIVKWRSLIDLIEPDGRIPEEVRRGALGIQYTQEALQYKVAVARIAERRGIDLWGYVGAQGGSLQTAIARLADYWFRPSDWPDHPRPKVPSTGPLWEIAYAHWQDPRWADIMLDGRPYGDRGHSAIRWTTLTNGIPLEPIIAGGPSPSPGATSVAIATSSPAPTSSPVAPITGLSVRLGSPLRTPVPITIRWDAPGIARTRVELERAVDGGGWSAMDVKAGANSASDSVRPSHVHAYRVRATVSGDVGPWATVSDISVERFEASRRTVDLSGPWERIQFGDYSVASALSTDADGATLTWRGTTQSIAIVGPMGPTRGRMIITVDGVRADVVDLFASRFRARTVLFKRTWRDGVVHELRIEARPGGGRRTVAVDDIVTLDSNVSDP